MDNDLISRSALFEEIEGIYKRHYEKSCYQFIHDFFKAIFRRINKAPAVDAETLRPTGHWNIRCYSTYDSWTQETDEEFYLECSECKREVWNIDQSAAMGGEYRKLVEQYPYCHCGCKMMEG